MDGKILIPLHGDEISPRFDLASEVWLGRLDAQGRVIEARTVVLPQASAEDLCHLVVTEGVAHVICNGIDQDHYDYLRWKRVAVTDGVMGLLQDVIDSLEHGGPEAGVNLFKPGKEKGHGMV
ncbi:MAG: dinitrogenase iron-molybdenum cofactor biosynthesis protein [Desulfovibrionaceae bacterium]